MTTCTATGRPCGCINGLHSTLPGQCTVLPQTLCIHPHPSSVMPQTLFSPQQASQPLQPKQPLRILFATEYLPPFISGISNSSKNLINGYRAEGHHVTVYSVAGTECDVVVPSVPNPFYEHQRVFILPPWQLMMQLLDFSTPVPYDIVHIVAPLCLSFVFLLPFLRMRGVKIYVAYHVYLDYYKYHYIGTNPLNLFIVDMLFAILYYIPLVWLADCVGIPSKTADNYVFKYSKRIHYFKSGLDTNVFVPKRIEEDAAARTLSAASSTASLSAGTASGSTKMIVTPSADSDLQISDLRRFAGMRSNDGPLLVYVGRLAVEKNVEFLVQAMGHPSLANATLVIVGDGPSRPGLEDMARSIVGAEHVYSPTPVEPSGSPVSDSGDSAFSETQASPAVAKTSATAATSARKRIIFTGMILNEHLVASYYGQCDIFVSASASETFGFTVAEAMACATPAVAVRSGAFETVYSMIDGWLFHEGDINDYATKISSVFKQGRSARRFARDVAVRGFTLPAAIRDQIGVYEWIVNGCIEAKQ
ncbi:hypothetical protein BC831DRAFT_447410 [Entophlyctis helioformis]|nr:hypothetical protein BC831DRAFT_447410 [Entophlyctis helioformis]